MVAKLVSGKSWTMGWIGDVWWSDPLFATSNRRALASDGFKRATDSSDCQDRRRSYSGSRNDGPSRNLEPLDSACENHRYVPILSLFRSDGRRELKNYPSQRAFFVAAGHQAEKTRRTSSAGRFISSSSETVSVECRCSWFCKRSRIMKGFFRGVLNGIFLGLVCFTVVVMAAQTVTAIVAVPIPCASGNTACSNQTYWCSASS